MTISERYFRPKKLRPFTIEAIVILPDHLHCLWTLPEGDAYLSGRWQDIKARFAARMPGGERLSERRQKKGERGIRPRRFWGTGHGDYIHYNPVKHGHVKKVPDWPYSSFHQYLRRGIYPFDWTAADEVRGMEME